MLTKIEKIKLVRGIIQEHEKSSITNSSLLLAKNIVDALDTQQPTFADLIQLRIASLASERWEYEGKISKIIDQIATLEDVCDKVSVITGSSD